MTPHQHFFIDTKAGFPKLHATPIVEAVIEVRVERISTWEESELRAYLEEVLDEYQYRDSQREFESQIQLQGGDEPASSVKDLGFRGIRMQTADGCNIGHFNRDGLTFSRLSPYNGWVEFCQGFHRLWLKYKEYRNTCNILRVGVRFINQFEIAPDEPIENYVDTAPSSPRGIDLPLPDFLHKEHYQVPGYPYEIKLVQALQPAKSDRTRALIVDIDVFTTEPTAVNDNCLNMSLEELRWLKNKMFFGTIAESKLAELQEN